MRKTILAVLAILLVVGSATTFTDDGAPKKIKVVLSSYSETPLVLSTSGTGRFVATINATTQEIQWHLSYDFDPAGQGKSAA